MDHPSRLVPRPPVSAPLPALSQRLSLIFLPAHLPTLPFILAFAPPLTTHSVSPGAGTVKSASIYLDLEHESWPESRSSDYNRSL